MGNPVQSIIYATTQSASQAQLTFTTEFTSANTKVTVDILQDDKSVQSQSYFMEVTSPVETVSMDKSSTVANGTLTLSSDGKTVSYSGNCVRGGVVAFQVGNVVVASKP